MPDTEIARLADRLMRRLHGALNAKAEEFDTHRLGPGGGMLLLAVADAQPARLQDLAAAMHRDKAQMTRGIQSLERKGLIARAADPGDARASRLSLTPEGETAVEAMRGAVAEALDGILAPLSDAQRAALRDILSRI